MTGTRMAEVLEDLTAADTSGRVFLVKIELVIRVVPQGAGHFSVDREEKMAVRVSEEGRGRWV